MHPQARTRLASLPRVGALVLSLLSVAAEPARTTPELAVSREGVEAQEETSSSYQEPLSTFRAGAPAGRYAGLTAAACRAELKRRRLPTKAARGAVAGVATPVRLTGALGSVRFLAPGEGSVYGMLDCRLVLALRDFADLLAEHQVTKVRVANLYRPKAHLPGKKARSQHAYGLAIDISAFVLADGRELSVARDFNGIITAPLCGAGSLPADTDESRRLRNIVCAAARAGLFHHVLTPNFNEAHRDHIHLDIKRDERGTVAR